MHRARWTLLGSSVVATLTVIAACGSRTGLPFDDTLVVSPPGVDGGPSVIRDGSFTDVPGDVIEEPLPLLDAKPLRDANRLDCPDADATLIYVVTNNDTLLSFYPPDATFKVIGQLRCPNDSRHPFSMAVDRKGVAYVLYATGSGSQPGQLFRVSTATAACIATPFAPPSSGLFDSFGMGYAGNDVGSGETLYVAADTSNGVLGSIDTTTFGLTRIGTFVPPLQRAELTGSGDGRLFAFYRKDTGGSAVAQLDKQTARVSAESPLPTVDQGNAWAFAFWGGDFYLFTASRNATQSTVTRFRPGDGSVVDVATYPEQITGAGVSTCAPQQ
jgi:hypothetical protein